MRSMPCKPVVAIQGGLLHNMELLMIGRSVSCFDLVHVLMLALGQPWGDVRDMTRAEISRATELARACMASNYQDCAA